MQASPALLLYKNIERLNKMNFKDEIFKTIQTMTNQTIPSNKSDRTYKSVIKRIVPKGYVILDDTGSERTVQCCIPGLELRAGQHVWVKIPTGDLRNIHICGTVSKKAK